MTYSELSTLRLSLDASSNWAKSTGTKRFRTHSSVWAFLMTSGKLWRATYIMGRSLKSRAMISDKTRASVFSSFTFVDSLVTPGHCGFVPQSVVLITYEWHGSRSCGSVSYKQLLQIRKCILVLIRCVGLAPVIHVSVAPRLEISSAKHFCKQT